MSRNVGIVVLVVVLLSAIGISFWQVFLRHDSAVPQETFAHAYGLALTDYDGKEVHLYTFRRKVLVAYAWASWCTYCGGELKQLAKLKAQYGDDVQMVAINRGESLQVARDFTSKLPDTDGLIYLLDPQDAFFKEIEGYAMPETVFIDSSGAVTFHQRGPMKLQEVDDKIKELLAR